MRFFTFSTASIMLLLMAFAVVGLTHKTIYPIEVGQCYLDHRENPFIVKEIGEFGILAESRGLVYDYAISYAKLRESHRIDCKFFESSNFVNAVLAQ